MKVPRGETLTRFLYSGGFSPQKEEVKYKAFIPQKRYPKHISVYCISSLTESEIWEIGREYVQSQRKIRARADFSSDIVYDQDNLKVILDPNRTKHTQHLSLIHISEPTRPY